MNNESQKSSPGRVHRNFSSSTRPQSMGQRSSTPVDGMSTPNQSTRAKAGTGSGGERGAATKTHPSHGDATRRNDHGVRRRPGGRSSHGGMRREPMKKIVKQTEEIIPGAGENIRII